MHNILITQKIFIDKHNQINWSLEDNWFKFFGKKKVNLIPINSNINNKKKLLAFKPKGLILSGGNDLYNIVKLKENLIRDNHEKEILKLTIKNKIPILAVCRGFQFVAKFFKCKISKTINHVKATHTLKINNKFFQTSENRKIITEQKIVQMKEDAIKSIKDASVKIAMESVIKLIKTSINKSKLDTLFEENLNQAKNTLKKTRA